MNQFSQNGFVAAKSVRHFHGRLISEESSQRRDGTVTRADVEFRIVRERVLSSIPK